MVAMRKAQSLGRSNVPVIINAIETNVPAQEKTIATIHCGVIPRLNATWFLPAHYVLCLRARHRSRRLRRVASLGSPRRAECAVRDLRCTETGGRLILQVFSTVRSPKRWCVDLFLRRNLRC